MSTQSIQFNIGIARTSILIPFLLSISISSYASQESEEDPKKIELDKKIEVIVVTANKKEQNLQDVASSVTAISGAQLEQLGLSKMEDIVLMTPSVTLQGNGQGGKAQIYMRGISDGGDGNLGGAGPSAAMYLDDQPVTTTRANPDIHAYDMARVEVLNGPQGTLYGASSQSGTIKMITNDANVDDFEAGIDLDYGSINDGGENTSVEFFVNIPLFDGNAALRIVGWDVNYGGYIDNTFGELVYPVNDAANNEPITTDNSSHISENFNKSGNKGMRAKFRYNFSEDWSMILSSYYQKGQRQGSWGRDPDKTGDDTTFFSVPKGSNEMKQFALTVKGSLGFSDVNFSAGQMSRDYFENRDFSIPPSSPQARLTCENLRVPINRQGAYFSGANNCGDPGGYQFETDAEFDRTTYELRLSSATPSPFQYVVGLYSEELSNDYGAFGFSPGKLEIYDYEWNRPGAIFESYNTRVDKQQAIFGEMSYDIKDFTLAFGARKFWTEVDIDIDTRPTAVFFAREVGPQLTNFESEENGKFLNKLSLAYRLNDEVLFYLSESEGYRAGGPNRSTDAAIPPQYEADFLTSREIGWKTRLADGRVKFNGAIFKMNWDDFQASTFDLSLSPIGFTGNVGNATIKGIEIDTTWYATRDFTLFGSIAHYKATIDDAYNQTENLTVNKGARLPWSPDYKATFVANYFFELPNGWDGVTRLMATYVGEKVVDLTSTDITESDPNGTTDPYTMVNWKIGINKNNWDIGFYIKNVLNKETQTYISFNDFEYGHTPRTIGFNVGYKY